MKHRFKKDTQSGIIFVTGVYYEGQEKGKAKFILQGGKYEFEVKKQ